MWPLHSDCSALSIFFYLRDLWKTQEEKDDAKCYAGAEPVHHLLAEKGDFIHESSDNGLKYDHLTKP